ncbi:MAG: Ig-like domain-containing protein [Chloroflexota bacterium]
MLFLLILAQPAAAQQESELALRLSRDFGYSSGTGRIQGTFSMKVTGPEDLTRVVFYIDEQTLGETTQAPFQLRFTTDSYPTGMHSLYAVGFTASGSELRSNVIRAEFVSAEEGWQEGLRIATPILVITFGVVVLSFVFSFISIGKRKNPLPGAQRKYGLAGGAICPKCSRPFSLNFMAPNLLVGKFDRCPFCGKWGMMRSRPLSELRAAEAAELQASQDSSPRPAASQEDKLRKELDDSRYQDL